MVGPPSPRTPCVSAAPIVGNPMTSPRRLPARGMKFEALKAFLASDEYLDELADVMDPSVGIDILFGAIDSHDEGVRQLEPFFASGTDRVLLRWLETRLRDVVKAEMKAKILQQAEVELKVLRSTISQLEHAEHKARAAACGAQLLMREERDTFEQHLASRERALKAERAERRKAEGSIEVAKQQAKAMQQAAWRHVEAARLRAKEAEKAAGTAKLVAEAKCESKLSEMRERLDALQVCVDTEAARADAATARADAAEKRAAEAEAKVSQKHRAEVKAAVSYMLGPGRVMAAAAKVRAAEWAAALDECGAAE